MNHYPRNTEAQQKFLADTDLLQHINGLQRFMIASCLSIESYGSGKRIFTERDPGDCLYIIQRGNVLISKEIAASSKGEIGKKLLLTILRPGKIFGEMACLDKVSPRRSASAEAVGPTTLFVLEVEQFRMLQDEVPSLVLDLLLFDLTDRLKDNNSHIEILASMHRPQRVARFLLDLANQHGEQDKDGTIRFDLGMPHKVAARLLNIGESALSKLLGDLQDAQIIRRDQQKADPTARNRSGETKPQRLFRILDPAALRKRASETKFSDKTTS